MASASYALVQLYYHHAREKSLQKSNSAIPLSVGEKGGRSLDRENTSKAASQSPILRPTTFKIDIGFRYNF